MHDNDPIISGSTPSYSYSKTSMNKKPLIIGGIIVGLLAVFALVFFIFIFPKLKSQPEPEAEKVVEIMVEDEDITEYATADDYLAELQHEIDSAETEEVRLSARLKRVSFLVSLEEYEQAETEMSGISTEGFSNNDFYRYYNVYSRIYDEDRNPEKYNEYRRLASEYLNKLQDENFDQIMNAAQE